MDVGTWKMLSQIAIFSGAVIAALGGLGNWYFGRVEDAAKEKHESERHTSLTAQLDAIGKKLSPFEELARARFPGVALDEALSKLRSELAQVRELATRDIYKPLQESIQERIVRELKALVAAKKMPQQVTLQLHNTSARNSQEFMAKFQEILRVSGVAFNLSVVSGMNPGLRGIWVILFAPDAEARVLAFVDALRPFITTAPKLERRDNIPSGGVEIVLSGPAEFNADGSVVLR